MYKTTEILGYKVFSGKLSQINLDKKHLINTFSPNSYGVALQDGEFRTALKNTDVLVLDGIGIAIGSVLLHGKNIKKIAGQDCFDYFMAKADKSRWKVFFLGSSEATLQKIYNRAGKDFPNTKVSGYSPPFKPVFSKEDNEVMVNSINSYNPDVLFVGMTAPKQEKWAYQHRELINARIVATIGNVFDWYAGNSKRPSPIWIKLRLEWFIRIFLRPEIFKRNTGNQLKYLRDLFYHLTYIKRIKE